MARLRWTDADEIGCQLNQKFPKLDPLAVRFTDLRDMVLALPNFHDDAALGGEAILEAIQMAWLEYHEAG